MAEQILSPKQFIQLVLIDQMSDIVKTHPYHAFVLIAVGLEFLGKCMLGTLVWDKPYDGALKEGIDLLISVDHNYATVDLRDLLRNGTAHMFCPKKGLVFSQESHGAKNFDKDSHGQIVLVIEPFYKDFVAACNKVIETQFPDDDKMNSGFLRIGEYKSDHPAQVPGNPKSGGQYTD